jgi:intracellular sulfur oxidation DsrE/DsrF family protein
VDRARRKALAMSSRAEFITSAAGVAIAVDTEAVERARLVRAGPYDFDAVARRLARPARHRQVFAVARVADGSVTSLLRHGLDAYELTRGEGPGALHPVAVFYARGVALGLDDAAWRTYGLADVVRRRGDALSPQATGGNPFAVEFRELARRGCTFLVCDNALADWAAFLVTSGSVSDSVDRVHVGLRRSLLPTALLVPAGVAALNDAQEARFTFVQASL